MPSGDSHREQSWETGYWTDAHAERAAREGVTRTEAKHRNFEDNTAKRSATPEEVLAYLQTAGKPVNYARIAKDTGCGFRALGRVLMGLVNEGHVDTRVDGPDTKYYAVVEK